MGLISGSRSFRRLSAAISASSKIANASALAMVWFMGESEFWLVWLHMSVRRLPIDPSSWLASGIMLHISERMPFSKPFAGPSTATTSPSSETVLKRMDMLCSAREDCESIRSTFLISASSVARMLARAWSRWAMALTMRLKISWSWVRNRVTAPSNILT